jgi:hypothetical protein
MGVTEALLGLARGFQVSYIAPRIGIGSEGRAEICTDDHLIGVMWVGAEAPARPATPRHLDVRLKLWNKTATPITVFDVTRAEAASRTLEPEGFDEATLAVGGTRPEQNFILWPARDDALRADVGDKLRLRVRRSRSRALRIRLQVGV